jgi:hypothetical protein
LGEQMSIQTNLNIIITLCFLALLSACGSSTNLNAGQDLSSTGLDATKPIAKCNKTGTSTLSFKIAAQVSGSSFDPNWANLYLTNLPTGFEAGSSMINFFKGQAANDTQLGYDSTTVPFAIYDRSTSTYLNNGGAYTSLKWSDVQNLIPGVSAAAFMSRVIFVLSLNDPNSSYQVLTVTSNNISDNSIIEAIPALLPTFYANPADYAIKSNGTPRETVLKNLHPLKNQTGDFTTLASALCQ